MQLLSVITTTFRNDDDLEATLRSISDAGLRNFELVVVDGVSADQSNVESVIDSSGLDPSIQVNILHGPDGGPYHAMNRGILHSTGRWLWFMNSGDRFVSTSSALLKAAESSQKLWVIGNSVADGSASDIEYQDGSMESLLRGDTPCHQAVLFNREAFAAVGLYDLRYRIAADYDVMLGIAQLGGPELVNSPVCLYQGGGLSDQQRTRSQSEYQLIRQRRHVMPLRAWPVGWARVARRHFLFRQDGSRRS